MTSSIVSIRLPQEIHQALLQLIQTLSRLVQISLSLLRLVEIIMKVRQDTYSLGKDAFDSINRTFRTSGYISFLSRLSKIHSNILLRLLYDYTKRNPDFPKTYLASLKAHETLTDFLRTLENSPNSQNSFKCNKTITYSDYLTACLYRFY